MTKAEFIKVVKENTLGQSNEDAILTAFEAYSSASNDGKPIVTGSAIVEICYKRSNGDVVVHYRREAGTEDANDLIRQVEEHQQKHGDKARYFHRIAT